MKRVTYIILFLMMITITKVDIQAIEKEHIFGGDLVHEVVIDNDLEVVDSKEEFYDFERFFISSAFPHGVYCRIRLIRISSVGTVSLSISSTFILS